MFMRKSPRKTKRKNDEQKLWEDETENLWWSWDFVGRRAEILESEQVADS